MSYRTHKESDEGIILLKRKILHSDVMIIVLTHHFGKVALLAKGVQKITSKRISALQTGNIVRVIFTEKYNTVRYLSSVELISHLSAIKKDLTKLQHLYTILFMFERLLPDSQIDPNVYLLCKSSIVQLAKAKTHEFSITKAMSNILSIMGYGECHSYEECVTIAEDIMGKKLPVGVI
ncbi:MAG: DNA repair protein RecO [Candidatus Roizmanbacteria bacterium]|nr:DNA repair protein RecO [Candidatus Roizmanbacteria bacterium]